MVCRTRLRKPLGVAPAKSRSRAWSCCRSVSRRTMTLRRRLRVRGSFHRLENACARFFEVAEEDPVKVQPLAVADGTLGLVARTEAATHRSDHLLHRLPRIVGGGHQPQQRDAQRVARPYQVFHAKRGDRRDATLAHEWRLVGRGAAAAKLSDPLTASAAAPSV